MAAGNPIAAEFEDVTAFLLEYGWIFDFKLTRIFQDNVLSNIPCEWRETLAGLSLEQLAELPFGNIQASWPESLKHFVENCIKFSLPREFTVSCHEQIQTSRGRVSSLENCTVDEQTDSGDKMCSSPSDQSSEKTGSFDVDNNKTSASCTGGIEVIDEVRENTQVKDSFTGLPPLDIFVLDPVIRKGMSDKKLHEVSHMTTLIDHVIRMAGNNGVVDVGSGLGYLGQVLHCYYGHSVLGLEGKQGHTSSADRRSTKLDCNYLLHNITCELYEGTQSQQEFTSLVTDWFSKLTGSTCSHQKSGTKTFSADNTNHLQTGSSKITEKNNIQTDKCENVFGLANACFQTGSGKKQNSQTGSQDLAEIHLTGKSECLAAELPVQAGSERKEFSEFNKTNDNLGSEINFDSSLTTGKCTDELLSPNLGKNVQKCVEKCEVPEKSGIPQMCMVGLHCCGDLTPTMLKCFIDLDIITSLCCVSCCYHRMSYDEETQKHENFPMSMLLKYTVKKTQQMYQDFRITPYCMRLAAQETRARWRKQTCEDHEFHTRNVAYRGVLEICLQQAEDSFKLKKCVRKLAHREDYKSFTKYVDAVFKHIHIQDKVPLGDAKELFHTKMQMTYDMYYQCFSLIEPLTALQYLVQPVIESLIYLDRQQWLKEQGYHAEIIPVFDELISPRNLALVACKHFE